MKKAFLLLLAVCFSATMFAADIIVTKDSQRISAKIEEVGLDAVKYRRGDNLTGPIYSIAKSDVQSITYENGYVETFNQYTPAKPSVVVQPQSNANANISREMLRNQCEENFQKGKTLYAAGFACMGMGVPMIIGGSVCAGLGYYGAGYTLIGLGSTVTVVGFPLAFVGQHKKVHAYDAYNNMYGSNLEFNITAGQNGIGLAMKF